MEFDPKNVNHRYEELSTGRKYHFIDQFPAGDHGPNSPTLLLVHGFPDCWYGWRHQIMAWAAKGWRVIVPDELGYGGTDQPKDIGAYTTKSLCTDLVALLDFLGVQRVILTVWRFCLWHPQRVRAVIALSVPFYPPAPEYVPMDEMVRRIPNFGYQKYLADPKSSAEIDQNIPTFIDCIYRSPRTGRDASFVKEGQLEALIKGQTPAPSRSDILSDKERSVYIDTFRKCGMYGPTMYYKTFKLRVEEEQAGQLPSSLPPSLPALFFWPRADPTCQAIHVQRMRKFVPSIEIVELAGKGHWLMVEASAEITAKVSEWVEALVQREIEQGEGVHKAKL
ncbi:alpha/beta-hydrolase [Ceratobasidium sp. AG-I]|nr:alpha/beta-hydrolase [Ceratobasidium sp. AG-I]